MIGAGISKLTLRPTTVQISLSASNLKLKFRLRVLISCLCFAAAWAVCFEDHMAGLDATETGNDISQPKFALISLLSSANEGARDSVDKLADYEIVEDDDDRGDLDSRVGVILTTELS